MINYSMKKIIVFLIVISLLSFLIYRTFFKKAELDFTPVEVVRGSVYQEISETGQVKKGDRINLGFELTGVIEKIYVGVGQEVKTGDVLAELESGELKIQLNETKANLDLAQAKLDKLLAGASQEEIQIVQTAVNNGEISLETAKQKLEDVKTQGAEDLKEAYEDALNVLNDAYLKISNALNTTDLIQRTYFTKNDQEGVNVRESKDKIETALNQIKPYLDVAKDTQSHEDIDITLSSTKTALNNTFDALKIIRDNCEKPAYENLVSLTNKTSLDTQRGHINTALTNIVNSQQTISSTKLTNVVNVNTYQADVDSSQGQLKAAQDELAQITAPPRKEDVDLHQAQVRQAGAQVQLLESQTEDTTLKSPVDGQVVQIGKRVGEIVQSMLQDPVITLLPASPFEIEVDIYEEDVAKMNIGNLVDISLVAFPEKILKGRVISINPAEEIIEGVVYYEVSISFDDPPAGVRPGMTVDLLIRTASRENVLVIPEEAIKEKNGKATVEVLIDETFKEREIEIGLRGSNDVVEVSSGLKEGEHVILR